MEIFFFILKSNDKKMSREKKRRINNEGIKGKQTIIGSMILIGHIRH